MKTIRGIVTSDKMNKTATVLVRKFHLHPVFKKRTQFRKKYHAQNLVGAKEGDEVEFRQCRPLSKTKKWKIIKIFK